MIGRPLAQGAILWLRRGLRLCLQDLLGSFLLTGPRMLLDNLPTSTITMTLCCSRDYIPPPDHYPPATPARGPDSCHQGVAAGRLAAITRVRGRLGGWRCGGKRAGEVLDGVGGEVRDCRNTQDASNVAFRDICRQPFVTALDNYSFLVRPSASATTASPARSIRTIC